MILHNAKAKTKPPSSGRPASSGREPPGPALPCRSLDLRPGPGRAPAGPGAHSPPAPAAAARSPAEAGRPAAAKPQGASRAPRRSQPQRRGARPRGFDTARPAAPEEAAAQEDVAEMKRKTGRRGLQAPTMEGATEEAPTPGCFPFSRSLSAQPRPACCHRRSPALQEPHRPKMAAPRLPPLPPAAGSDAAAAWSSANQRVRSKLPAAVARGDSSCWFGVGGAVGKDWLGLLQL